MVAARTTVKAGGYSIMELLVVIAVLSILAAIVIQNYTMLTFHGWNTTAQSDYRNVKTAVLSVLAQPGAPANFAFSNLVGPGRLPEPLAEVLISEQTLVTVSHRTRYRNNRPPTVTTTITISNRKGNKQYRYSEVNGVITEQIINLT